MVKAFNTEVYEFRRFRDAARRLLRSNLRYVRQQAISSPLIEMFGALTIVGLLTYARIRIKTGALTAGEFTSFVIALLMMYEPLKRLTGIHNIFQQAIGVDPGYALAFTGLADCYSLLPIYDRMSLATQTMPQAKTAILRALAIDDNLAEAHASLADFRL